MEEILASIRRIIADEDTSKTAPKAAMPPAPTPVTPPPAPPPRAAAPAPRPAPTPPAAEALKQAEIDAMLSDLNAAPAPPPPPAAPDVLELTESMTAVPAPAPAGGFRTIDGQSDIVFDESSDTEPPADPDDGRERRFEGIKPDLISASTSDAVNSAFNSLAQTVLVQNARTLEDLVREMLRPMLKTWLDDNLPGLVERLVRQEIDRVSRGRS